MSPANAPSKKSSKREKLYPIVLIQWIDAVSVDAWTSVADMPDEMMPCYTAGFLIRENRNSYYVANTHTIHDTEEELLASGTMIIPKKWVQKVEYLRDVC